MNSNKNKLNSKNKLPIYPITTLELHNSIGLYQNKVKALKSFLIMIGFNHF